MQRLRKLAQKSGDLFKSFSAPAADPREMWSEPGERELEVLKRARSARQELSDEIDRLAALADRVRTDLAPLEEREQVARSNGEAHVAEYVGNLRSQAEAELIALESQVDQMRDQLEMVTLTEQRIASHLSMALDEQQKAGPAASSDVEAAAGELHRLTGVVEGARKAAGRLAEKAEAVYQLANAGNGVEKWSDDGGMRWLRRRYELAINRDRPREWIEAGRRGLSLIEQLHSARAQVTSAAERTAAAGLRSGYVTALTEETCRLAMRSLRWGLEMIETAGPEGLSSIERHFEHAEQCVRAMDETRDQLDALLAGESQADVSAATGSLKRAMEQAAVVQSELNELGI